MKTVKLNVFEVFSLSWMAISLVSIFLALIHLFYPFFTGVVILGILFLVWILAKKKTIQITGFGKNSWIILSLICTLGIFLSIFTTPTIFGGRDEGSYTVDAIMISQNHAPVFSSQLINQFYQIYGPGKALNFPGFYYTDNGSIKSQFLPAYPAWIATWYQFLGLTGIKFVNLFPFITFIFSFYLLIREIAEKAKPLSQNKKPGLVVPMMGIAILATTFPIIVFYKFTLGEIYFGSLLWFTIYLFSKYSRNKSAFRYGLIFIPLAILPFARIEALILLFMFLSIFILKDYTHFRFPRYQLPFVILGILFIIVFAFEPNFFIDSVKNIAEPFFGSETPTGQNNFSILSDDWQGLYSLKLFYTYNLLPIFVIGTAFLINLLRKSQRKMIKNESFLIPLILFAPTLLYLIDANISLDHPWYLRRLVFSIIPMFIFYACFLLLQIKISFRWIFWPITILIVLVNLFLLFPISKNGKPQESFLIFSQNKNLLSQIQKISANFSEKDLVLISQQSSGSGWSLMSEPMREIFGKQAVYFFNPNDLDKIDKNKFKSIYLISSPGELDLYKDIAKTELKKYKINNAIIRPSRNPNQKPSILQTQTETIIFQIQ